MAVVGGALHPRDVGDEVEGAAVTPGTGSMVTEGSREVSPSLAPSAQKAADNHQTTPPAASSPGCVYCVLLWFHIKSFMQKPALNTCPHLFPTHTMATQSLVLGKVLSKIQMVFTRLLTYEVLSGSIISGRAPSPRSYQ